MGGCTVGQTLYLKRQVPCSVPSESVLRASLPCNPLLLHRRLPDPPTITDVSAVPLATGREALAISLMPPLDTGSRRECPCISVGAAQRHCWQYPRAQACHQCVAVLHGQHLCHLQVEGLFVARKLSHLPPIASCWSSSSTAPLDPCCMHPAPLPCPAAAITGYRLMAVSSAGTVMTEGSGTPLGNGQVGGGAPHHVARCHTHTRAGHMPSTCLHPVLPKMTMLAS